MSKSHKKKRPPKRALALPDLQQTKAFALNGCVAKIKERARIGSDGDRGSGFRHRGQTSDQ